MAERLRLQLNEAHKELCPWRDNPSPPSFASCAPLSAPRAVVKSSLANKYGNTTFEDTYHALIRFTRRLQSHYLFAHAPYVPVYEGSLL